MGNILVQGIEGTRFLTRISHTLVIGKSTANSVRQPLQRGG
jgi:hypothetical protein